MAKTELSAEEHYRRRLSVEEFLVDFLGGLVPGVLFMVSAVFAVVPAIHAVTQSLSNERKSILFDVTTLLESIQGTPNTVWLMVFTGGLLFAYVIGHLFYRHDPKKADRSSFKRLAGRSENNTDKNKCYNLGCANEDDCEFPYPDYDKYLEQRELTHLLPFVLWKSNKRARSKTYVNLLKVRLRHYFPDKCGQIVRNEAHVRLASSTWYVSIILMWIGAGALTLSIASLLWSQPEAPEEWPAHLAWHMPALVAPVVVVAVSAFAWWTIRGFLHYQRLREVFFVLETAHTAFRGNYDVLFPPFDSLGDEQGASKKRK